MDEGHVWAVLDVFIVTHDVNGILAGLPGPVLDVTGAIILVIVLYLRLGGAFNGKPWGQEGRRPAHMVHRGKPWGQDGRGPTHTVRRGKPWGQEGRKGAL